MQTMKINFGPKFDWFDVLNKLNEGNKINIDDKVMLREQAGCWPLCACGQLCKLLPRHRDNGAPIDHELMQLGVKFAQYVNEEKWDWAMDCLVQIEKRTTLLLRERGINVVLVEHPRHFERVSDPKPCTPKMGNRQSFAAGLMQHTPPFQKTPVRH